ncbi:MAG: winged helix DNA-binding domain-containing protein [Gaiellaceae bacterium MAG52_C11]|nr:winged helix DNA-binding domain-containing protein [Candidatus Gaiellasilicea maunaloa]
MTWEQVRARRLARHHLVKPAPRTRLVELVREVGGVHAQVMSAAELALSARLRGLTREHVSRALWKERSLVKTWTLRGTLHLHPADELGLWLAARRAAVGDWYFANEVRPKEAKQILAALSGALDGRCLTRDELVAAVTPHVSGWAREHIGSGWGTVLGPAALNGTLVHGPPQGTRVTFVRPDQWLGVVQQEWQPQAALAEVLRRYLAAFGPATHREFAQWVAGSQFKAKDAEALLGSIAGELVEVDVEGREAWLLAGDAKRPASPEGIRLIPEYDAYVMGFRERRHLFSPEAVARTKAHGKGRLEGPGALSWLLVGGVVAGTWSRKRAGKKVELRVESFAKLTRAQLVGLEREAARVAACFGLEPQLIVR